MRQGKRVARPSHAPLLLCFSFLAMQAPAIPEIDIDQEIAAEEALRDDAAEPQLPVAAPMEYVGVGPRVAPVGPPGAQDPNGNPDWFTGEVASARGMVYLVTFAAVLPDTVAAAAAGSAPLRSLEGITREQIRDAVLDACANPTQRLQGARGRRRANAIVATKLVVFLEEPRHFHVAIKFTEKTAFLPIKTALRARAGLASHWGCTHTQFWSAVRYGTFATERKPVVDVAPLGWTRDGEPLDFYGESQEPWNAHLAKRRREVF